MKRRTESNIHLKIRNKLGNNLLRKLFEQMSQLRRISLVSTSGQIEKLGLFDQFCQREGKSVSLSFQTLIFGASERAESNI